MHLPRHVELMAFDISPVENAPPLKLFTNYVYIELPMSATFHFMKL